MASKTARCSGDSMVRSGSLGSGDMAGLYRWNVGRWPAKSGPIHDAVDVFGKA